MEHEAEKYKAILWSYENEKQELQKMAYLGCMMTELKDILDKDNAVIRYHHNGYPAGQGSHCGGIEYITGIFNHNGIHAKRSTLWSLESKIASSFMAGSLVWTYFSKESSLQWGLAIIIDIHERAAREGSTLSKWNKKGVYFACNIQQIYSLMSAYYPEEK